MPLQETVKFSSIQKSSVVPEKTFCVLGKKIYHHVAMRQRFKNDGIKLNYTVSLSFDELKRYHERSKISATACTIFLKS